MREQSLRTFLEHRLSVDSPSDIQTLIGTLKAAGERYIRYFSDLQRPKGHKNRRHNLREIADQAVELRRAIASIDSIFRDDFESRFGPEKLERLLGHLHDFEKYADDALRGAQPVGRPRDLAQERWVLELAEIYETNTRKAARILGPGSEKDMKKQGPFYEFLNLSRPEKFVRDTFLDSRQIRRILARRQKELVPPRGKPGPQAIAAGRRRRA